MFRADHWEHGDINTLIIAIIVNMKEDTQAATLKQANSDHSTPKIMQIIPTLLLLFLLCTIYKMCLTCLSFHLLNYIITVAYLKNEINCNNFLKCNSWHMWIW